MLVFFLLLLQAIDENNLGGGMDLFALHVIDIKGTRAVTEADTTNESCPLAYFLWLGQLPFLFNPGQSA